MNPKATAVAGILAAAYGHLGRRSEARAALETFHKGWANKPNLPDIKYFHPFKIHEFTDRVAASFLKAGVPGKPGDYYKTSGKLKLTGNEIGSLFFGRKATGI